MKCKVDGCSKPPRYQGHDVCNMHYFRMRRNGSYDLQVRKRKTVRTPNNYIKIYDPAHPLADVTGYVYEHRAIAYSAFGPKGLRCSVCDALTTWSSCHVDHIDNVTDRNVLSNLRITCNPCNVMRGRNSPEHTYKNHYSITFQGETKTPTEWSRDERTSVSGKTILQRKKAGMSDEDALFAKKITHKGSVAKARQLRGSRGVNGEWSRNFARDDRRG